MTSTLWPIQQNSKALFLSGPVLRGARGTSYHAAVSKNKSDAVQRAQKRRRNEWAAKKSCEGGELNAFRERVTVSRNGSPSSMTSTRCKPFGGFFSLSSAFMQTARGLCSPGI